MYGTVSMQLNARTVTVRVNASYILVQDARTQQTIIDFHPDLDTWYTPQHVAVVGAIYKLQNALALALPDTDNQ